MPATPWTCCSSWPGAPKIEAVRVSAIKELLDRGIGKSGAPDPDAPILTRIERVIVHPKD